MCADHPTGTPRAEARSPPYMSPERAADEHDRPGQRGYNLGATLSCLLTGRAPFEGTLTVRPRVRQGDFPPPREVDPTISPAPEDRFVSHRDLADAIEHWLAEEPIAAYRAAVASDESLVREHPGASDDHEGLARGRMDLGGVPHVLALHAEAEAGSHATIAEYAALVAEHSGVTSDREGLA
jgi:serine/threonine protein kinase